MEIQAQNPDKKNFKGGITDQNIDKIILLPMKHVKSILKPANTINLAVIQVLSHWIRVPEEKLAIIKDIIINLNAYSAIDDILDGTVTRGGLPASHKIFGIANTVIAFDFLLQDTFRKVLELNHPEAMKICLEGIRGTLAGQSMEVYGRDNYTCPTEEEYCRNTHLKTTSSVLLLGRLMQLFDDAPKDVERLLATIGLRLQISDDYNSLTSPKHFESKGMFCDDITEGKFSFPIVHAINTHPEVKDTLINILKQQTTDIQLKNQFLSILEECGSFEYALKQMENLKCIMYEEINKLGENPHILQFLECFQETN